MNWYSILQSILVYVLTSFSVAVATWAAKTSKRITILEEHDKAQSDTISLQNTQSAMLEQKLDAIVKTQTEMSTKLDLLLSGQIKIQ